MPLPDRNDPARPLVLATRSTRLLGLLSIGIGLFVMISFGYLNPLLRFRAYFLGGGFLVLVIPGVLFLVCAAHLPRRSRTAVGFGIATAALQLVGATLAFVASITLQPVSPVPVILAALWIAALSQLIGHLWHSLESIALDTTVRHGFDLSSTAAPVRVLPLNSKEPA